MRVLLVAPLPPPYGGIANWSQIMLDYVKNTNDEICTLNIAPKKRSTEGRNLFDRVFISGLDMLKKRNQLKKKLTEYKPDVIHMTTSGSLAIIRDILFIKTAAKYRIPVVYHIHFGKTPEMANSGSFAWKLFKKALSIASAVIAIDRKTYNCVLENVGADKAYLVPNPINRDNLPDIVGTKKKQVVFLGWVVPTKGIEELVSAWNVIGEEFSEYELTVIGPFKQEYLTKVKELARIKSISFTGELAHSEAMKILSESQVFVLPSYTEGLPNVILEAMALKNAVIASNVGAIPEILAGDCGVIIKPKSKEQIVTALRKVLSDSDYREYIAENAFNKVKSEYAIEKVYKLYAEIWKKAMWQD